MENAHTPPHPTGGNLHGKSISSPKVALNKSKYKFLDHIRVFLPYVKEQICQNNHVFGIFESLTIFSKYYRKSENILFLIISFFSSRILISTSLVKPKFSSEQGKWPI